MTPQDVELGYDEIEKRAREVSESESGYTPAMEMAGLVRLLVSQARRRHGDVRQRAPEGLDLDAIEKRAKNALPDSKVQVSGDDRMKLALDALNLVAEVRRLEEKLKERDFFALEEHAAVQKAERERDEARTKIEQLKTLLKSAVAEGGKQLERIETLTDLARRLAALPRRHDSECHPSEGRHSEDCLRAKALLAEAREKGVV